MDKEEAIKILRELHDKVLFSERTALETLHPELKESEDEKIRKALVRFHKGTIDIDGIKGDDILAWLEKQGEEDSSIQQAYEWGYTEGKRIERKHWIEKQNFSEDYNSIDPQFGKPINKVEPKFKDGDVLCYKDEISLYKHDIKNCTKQETTFGGFVYHCCYDGKRFITDSLYSLTEQDKMDIHPATKEQRDLLFQKMKEAGYTFDFEKKELKKIEQPELTEFEEAVKDMIDDYRDAIDAHAATTEEVKERAAYMLSLIPHKSAEWSEEDEEIINGITSYLCTHDSCELDGFNKWYDWLKSLKNRVQPQPKQEWRKNEKQIFADIITIVGKSKAYIREYQRELVDFLKFLKERYTWKPSDEQMIALEYIIDNAHNTSYSCKIAKKLLEQLRKLKGE